LYYLILLTHFKNPPHKYLTDDKQMITIERID